MLLTLDLTLSVCVLRILEDVNIGHMIQWVNEGTAFRVASPADFSRIVLPVYFKHANWQSFVRQLNMYGFHKVTQPSTIPAPSAPTAAADDLANQIWEFRHPSFRRGDVHLLCDIKRKSSRQAKQQQQQQQQQTQQQAQQANVKTESVDDDGMSSNSGDGDRSNYPPQAGSGIHSRRASFGPEQAHGIPFRGRADGHADGGDPYAASRENAAPMRSPNAHFGHPHSAGMLDSAAGPGFASFTNARMEELSDRIDAIIRHSSYLESQCRSLTEQVRIAQSNEQVLRVHAVAAIDRLAGFCTSMHRGDRDYNASETRSGLLDAAHRELDHLYSLTGASSTLRHPPHDQAHAAAVASPPQPTH